MSHVPFETELTSSGLRVVQSDNILYEKTWDEIISEHFILCTNLDDKMVVDDHVDSVSDSLKAIDAMREAADKMEEMLRTKMVYIEGENPDITVSFSKYIRGEF